MTKIVIKSETIDGAPAKIICYIDEKVTLITKLILCSQPQTKAKHLQLLKRYKGKFLYKEAMALRRDTLLIIAKHTLQQ